jgi:hypothetical protein
MISKTKIAKIAISCGVVTLFIGAILVAWVAHETNRLIDLCMDDSAPNYIKDQKAREAACTEALK